MSSFDCMRKKKKNRAKPSARTEILHYYNIM